MDEEIQQPAENEVVETPDVTESPTVEETTEPVTEEVTEEVAEESQPKRNAESRIKQLLKENKELKRQQQNPFSEAMNQPIPENLSEEQYRALVADSTNTAIEVENLKRQMALDRFESDSELVLKDYPELNPDSESYDEELATTLADAYWESHVVKDANGNFVRINKSLKDFTSQMIKPYRNALNKGAVRTSEALQQQASESPVTPESSKSSDSKAFEDLSIAEMEARLGIVRN